MHLYPLLMKPYYQERPWGGRRLAQWPAKSLPPGPIGESWEISTHPNGLSLVGNGEFEGESLASIVDRYPKELMGSAAIGSSDAEFPLLVKLIDVEGIASLQVHPDDEQARSIEGYPRGKTEAWYILSRSDEAECYVGLAPGIDRRSFVSAIERSRFEECLNRIHPAAGDCIFLPPGTVHACGRGVLLLEIQQSCDLTYRVYDWGRTDAFGRKRELHVEKALQVIDFAARPVISRALESDRIAPLVSTPGFTIGELRITENLILPVSESFMAMTAVEGSCVLAWDEGSFSLPAGTSAVVPAQMQVEFRGSSCKLVVASMPADGRA